MKRVKNNGMNGTTSPSHAQTEKNREEEVKAIVERVFKEAFVSVCPDIKPGVSFDPFAE
jgi:hypothetical protein